MSCPQDTIIQRFCKQLALPSMGMSAQPNDPSALGEKLSASCTWHGILLWSLMAALTAH